MKSLCIKKPGTGAPFLKRFLAIRGPKKSKISFLLFALALVVSINSKGKIITTVAGGGSFGDGGTATVANLNNPYGVCVDGSGNMYIADYGNNRIRKVAPGGIISTIAGNGTLGYSGDGGAATEAKIHTPEGITIDNLGNLYFVDGANSV